MQTRSLVLYLDGFDQMYWGAPQNLGMIKFLFQQHL